MLSKLVSIIIPIYNAENRLHHCMNSVLHQTYRRIEVILMNDGSTDQSGSICDHYGEIDERVKVIHQKNYGPSHARNKGVLRATGDYIQFVDADDYMDPKMTETLVKASANDHQLVICGYQSIYTYKKRLTIKKYIPSIQGSYYNRDFIKYFGKLYQELIIPSPCNKLYDANLIRKREIHFKEDMNYGEDLLFNLAYMRACSTIKVIPDPLYNYFITSHHSLSRKFNENLRKNQQVLSEAVQDFLILEKADTGENEDFINIMYANQMMNALNNLFHINSTFTHQQRKKEITAIIDHAETKQLTNFFTGNFQIRIIGLMMKYNFKKGIYYFFLIKKRLQQQLNFMKESQTKENER